MISLKTFMLSKSETSELLDKLGSAWPQDAIPKVKSIKVYEVEKDRRLLIANDMVAVHIQDSIVPFLGNNPEVLQRFPSVTVDMGAVKFVCNGAKVMRPGITNFGSFKKSDIVMIKDQTHDKVIAVGVALENSEQAKLMAKGYVIENLHYISDKMWEAYKEI
ncbi:MAG TPA: PUA domain-containing protein [Nitrososphaera sp.]|jgi:PUA domain protein|nr:PUA domain-containing protein [Nitrososphaera sp.]